MDGFISCEVGHVCAVQSDGRWYRGEVTDIKEYPEILVSLLDKHLSITAHVSEVRRLPEELVDIPRTVLRCSLYGINPASASSERSLEVTQ